MNRGTSVATTMLMLPSEYMQQLSYHFLGMYCVFKPSTNKETKNPKTNKQTEYKYIFGWRKLHRAFECTCCTFL